ncbi:hypothetical protein OO25_14780 [Phaeobacter sp. S60]|nr:hypothetical protein OO25_14780 [Phaeobacter sp. S60]
MPTSRRNKGSQFDKIRRGTAFFPQPLTVIAAKLHPVNCSRDHRANRRQIAVTLRRFIETRSANKKEAGNPASC